MENQTQAVVLRSKILGVLLLDARQANGKSLEDCAAAVGVSAEEYAAYENGQRAPSLPELEALARFLQISPDHFLGRKVLEKRESTPGSGLRLLDLRHRMIGAMVRKARLEMGYSLEGLAEMVGLTPAELESGELGEASFSIPHLESLATVLNRPVQQFQDRQAAPAVSTDQSREVQNFLMLPADLQDFVAKPVNRPYLELALRLSEMSVDKLRSIGEGILEITL